MTLFAVGGWAAWAVLLILSQFGPRRAGPDVRLALRWIFIGGLLICTAVVVGAIVDNDDWTRIHRTVGGAQLAVTIVGLICLAVGAVKMRRSLIGRQGASSPID
jgi:hypothetical protein